MSQRVTDKDGNDLGVFFTGPKGAQGFETLKECFPALLDVLLSGPGTVVIVNHEAVTCDAFMRRIQTCTIRRCL